MDQSKSDADKILIVCDGSSCVQGANHPGHDWPRQLGEMLGDAYRVVNLGVGGQPTTAVIAAKLRESVLALLTGRDTPH